MDNEYDDLLDKDAKDKPENLDECISYLLANVSEEDKAAIRRMPERDMSQFHFSTGMAMRNSWGLWGRSALARWFNSVGVYHADDMSGIIMTSLHRTLAGKPINLDVQVKYYEGYWIKSLGDDGYRRMIEEFTRELPDD